MSKWSNILARLRILSRAFPVLPLPICIFFCCCNTGISTSIPPAAADVLLTTLQKSNARCPTRASGRQGGKKSLCFFFFFFFFFRCCCGVRLQLHCNRSSDYVLRHWYFMDDKRPETASMIQVFSKENWMNIMLRVDVIRSVSNSFR